MTQSDFNLVSVVRPYEQIVEQIEGAIRDNRYPRGAKLPTERELAESFGVSRSVVREAIKVLATSGLVESRQGSGTYVSNNPIPTITRAFTLSVSPDAESLDHIFEFRRMLEVEAARLAAQRRSDDDLAAMSAAIDEFDPETDLDDFQLFASSDFAFHSAVARASKNPYLAIAVTTARDLQSDVVALFAGITGQMQIAVSHHKTIFAAIANGNADRAANEMDSHIRYSGAAVQSRFSSPEQQTASDSSTLVARTRSERRE